MLKLSESMDEALIERLRGRYLELAGMLKEKKSGYSDSLNKIMAKFCLQEGIKVRTGKMYLRLLIQSGLVIVTSGKRRWKYNSDAEWELFKVNI